MKITWPLHRLVGPASQPVIWFGDASELNDWHGIAGKMPALLRFYRGAGHGPRAGSPVYAPIFMGIPRQSHWPERGRIGLLVAEGPPIRQPCTQGAEQAREVGSDPTPDSASQKVPLPK
jgi:hypothetical protein